MWKGGARFPLLAGEIGIAKLLAHRGWMGVLLSLLSVRSVASGMPGTEKQLLEQSPKPR